MGFLLLLTVDNNNSVEFKKKKTNLVQLIGNLTVFGLVFCVRYRTSTLSFVLPPPVNSSKLNR